MLQKHSVAPARWHKTRASSKRAHYSGGIRVRMILVIAIFPLIAALSLGAEEARVTFTNPIVESGADPWVIRWENAYLYCSSGGDRVWVRRAKQLHEIGSAAAVAVWTPPPDTAYSKNLWAAELHRLQDHWYIYVAADDGKNHNHRMYVLERTEKDPMGPFTFKGKIASPDDLWAIDGTVLQTDDGRLFFIWSGWQGNQNGSQELYIAPMSNPWTISGPRTQISKPEFPWELRGRPLINEGPEVLRNGKRVFVVYSASGSWTDNYCLGLLELVGTDPLDASAWKKKQQAVFSRTADVFGPGHASFVKSPDGREDWIVYHAAKRQGGGWDRSVRMQKFGWNADGTPDFGRPVSTGNPLPVPSGTSR